MRTHLLSVAFALWFLAGCGAPKEGDSCSQTGFLCLDSSAALECKAERWTKLPCKGPGGCKREGELIKCDMSGNLEGDACASTAEGKGLCNSTQTATLECREGVLRKTNDCITCTVTGDQIACQQ
ncbi:MAG: hypothetical protein HYZ28_07805 [Myxococcales bacterium]|nr:hypothetical protein [Myxococcales bacterium]